MRKGFAVLAGAMLATTAFVGIGAHSALADQRDFRQYNNSSMVIVREFISPASAENWGQDQLRGAVIMPGDYHDFRFSPSVDYGACIFDIRLDASDGTSTTNFGVDLCQGGTTLTFN